jgi:hypothetical protein
MNNATVVRVRGAGYDDNGDPIAGTPTRTTIAGCTIAPRSQFGGASSDISGRGRQGVLVGLTLYAPYGTDIVHTDQLEVDGDLFEVDGEVGPWKNPFTGWEAGIEVALNRAAG